MDVVLYRGRHKNSKLFVDIERVIERDAYKDQLCIDANIALLRLDDVEFLAKSTQKVREKLHNLFNSSNFIA